MNFKVGDRVICSVETQKNGLKRLLIKDPAKTSKVSQKEFLIVYFDERTQFYTLILDDDITGWIISKWHVKYLNISDKYIGKRFYDVPETVFEEKGKK